MSVQFLECRAQASPGVKTTWYVPINWLFVVKFQICCERSEMMKPEQILSCQLGLQACIFLECPLDTIGSFQ
jgi:hypothetical protein